MLVEHSILIIITLSVVIVISPFLAKITKLPTTIIEILAGSIAAYYSFLEKNFIFSLVAEVGFFYLMFLAGAEVDLRVLLKLDKKIIKYGSLYIISLYLLSLIFTFLFGLHKIFIVIMPLISVGLILALFKEYGKDTKWLNFAMTIGILGELVSIIVLTFTGATLEHGVGMELYKTIALLIVFLTILAFLYKILNVIFWWYPEFKLFLMPHHDKDEKDIRLSMALFFIMIVIMEYLNLEIAFGAFIAGIFIATFFEHKAELPHKLSTFGFGFFIPIFFIHIGSTFDLENLTNKELVLNALKITTLMIIIRAISSLVFSKKIGLQNSILLALSHSMPLTLLIAVASIAYKAGTITSLYYSFILASLFEVIISMITIKIIMTQNPKPKSDF